MNETAQKIKSLIDSGMNLYQAEITVGEYKGWCNRHAPEISHEYKDRKRVESLTLHAGIVEKWAELGFCKIETVAMLCGVSGATARLATSRYIKKGVEENTTLKSKV